MKKSTLRCLFQFMVSVLPIMFLLLSCQDQRQDLIAYKPLGNCGRVITLNGIQYDPIEAELCIYQMRWSPNGKYIVLIGSTEFGMSVWVANTDRSNLRQVSSEFDQVTAEWLSDDFLLIDAILGDPRSLSTSKIMNYTLDLQDGTIHIYSRNLQLRVLPIIGNRWITFDYQDGICLHSLDSDAIPMLQNYSVEHNAFDVSPSGREMVFVSHFDLETYYVYTAILNGDNIEEHTLIYTLDAPVAVRWSPDGKYVALLSIQGALHILDTTDFSLVGEFAVGELEDESFMWSPHSDAIAVSQRCGKFSYMSEIVLIDVYTGTIVQLNDNDTVEYILDWQEIDK